MRTRSTNHNGDKLKKHLEERNFISSEEDYNSDSSIEFENLSKEDQDFYQFEKRKLTGSIDSQMSSTDIQNSYSEKLETPKLKKRKKQIQDKKEVALAQTSMVNNQLHFQMENQNINNMFKFYLMKELQKSNEQIQLIEDDTPNPEEDIDDDLFEFWKQEDLKESDAKLLAKTELKLDDLKFLSEKELEEILSPCSIKAKVNIRRKLK